MVSKKKNELERMVKKKRSWLRKLRRVPLSLGGAVLILFADPTIPGMIVGTSLIMTGEILRIWGTGHLEKNETLTVTGPYAYVKNPLYVGSILITVGFCILANNIYVLALATLMFCFHYIPYKKKVEGERLKKIFGRQYEDYDEHVRDYLPRFTPYSDRRAPWKFRTFWENSEAGIVILNLLGILVILSRPYWNSRF
jgi:protein-S-isoprenylcysteine O-methyltransferase Ste14